MSQVPINSAQEQAFAPNFEQAKLLEAKRLGWQAIEDIESLVTPGMTEIDGEDIAKRVIEKLGGHKPWHRTHVRFGVNTTKIYSEQSLPDVRLSDNDIWFLDLGPVFGGYEADVGQTFCTGLDPALQALKDASRAVFDACAEKFRHDRLTGIELYRFATAESERMGYELVDTVSGHRLSEFPHHAHFRGSLADRDYTIIPGAWVLEIQLRDPKLNRGAFFEDLLI